jgi:hypothetical protein
MPRLLPTLMPADLELRLLRKSVGVLDSARERCADCGRTPLTGELVHRYPHGETVCELCSAMRREDPVRTTKVLHSEHGQTVKVRAA